jgi:ketosteroid isomerase-like protein
METRMRFTTAIAAAWILLAASGQASAHPGHAHGSKPPPPVAAPPATPLDAPGTASAFSAALAKGDTSAVLSFLAENVVIYESGGQESSRDEYASHHLPLDIAFMAGMKVQVLDRKQGGSGDVAWVITRSRFTGTYKGKAVDSYSTESLVLQQSPQGWKIVHVHWSSQPVEPKAS